MDQKDLRKGILVPAGKDRFSGKQRMIWGATLPTPDAIEKAFAAHDMTVVGPPLKVD